MATRIHIMTLILGAALLAPGVAIAAPQTPSETRGTVTEVLVERVVWPVFIEPQRCRTRPADEFIVTEDGQPCRVASLNEDPPARVHAILVDNSGSMVLHLERLKQAAKDYVRSFPEGEPVIVTSFADNVFLEAGISKNRQEQIDAIYDLKLGNTTALLDALHYMLRYVEPRPERKVVIVFTDTFDNASLGLHNDEQILAVAQGIPGLTLFVVHFLGTDAQGPNARPLLERLARETGGDYFEVGKYGSFAKVFRAIRNRLDSEVFLSYAPAPFGDGPLDDAANRTHRFREVKIKARPGSPCKVISAGPPTRLVGESPGSEGRFYSVKTDVGKRPRPAASAGFCPPDDRRWVIEETYRLPDPVSRPGETSESPLLFRAQPPSRLFGRTWDILTERGFCYDPDLFHERGRYRVEQDRPSEFAFRDFAVDLPPVQEVRRNIRTAGDVLLHLMDSGICTVDRGDDGSPRRHPIFVHGQTWLELRRHLAEAIYLSRPDYRDWARARLTHDRLVRTDAALRAYRKETGISDAETERLRRVLFEQIEPPGAGEVHNVLSEWIADVPAIDAALDLQTQLANRMLRRNPDHAEERAAWLEQVGEFWNVLNGLLPPPTGVRVLTPLVPAYDSNRDVIGFYRLVLPTLRGVGPPLDSVPERPFGLEILDRLLEDQRLAQSLARSSEVIGMETVPYAVPLAKGAYGFYHPPPPAADGSYPPIERFQTTIHLRAGERGEYTLRGVHARVPGLRSGFVLSCVSAKENVKVRHNEIDIVSLIDAFATKRGMVCGEAPPEEVEGDDLY